MGNTLSSDTLPVLCTMVDVHNPKAQDRPLQIKLALDVFCRITANHAFDGNHVSYLMTVTHWMGRHFCLQLQGFLSLPHTSLQDFTQSNLPAENRFFTWCWDHSCRICSTSAMSAAEVQQRRSLADRKR